MSNQILIVDDESYICEYLQDELQQHFTDYEFTTTTSGLQALTIINSGGVCLLITDIAMPDIDGYELFTRARQITPELPVIMMTGFGYDPNHAVVKSRKEGLKDVIFKPFNMEKLIALINLRLKNGGPQL